MNKRPVCYSQKDPRWRDKPYRAPGEEDTIGASGCGPSCAAMLISTITGKTYTPEDACRWSVEHGYKAKGQGTYYSYFTPQFAEFGIGCQMLNWAKTYGKPDHPNHELVAEKLRQGYYAVALMKRGLWTPTGHFVVLWWEDDKARINDPNSARNDRTNGDLRRFRSEVQYYWLVDAREHNRLAEGEAAEPEKEAEEMTQEQFNQMFSTMRDGLQDNDCGSWSREAREWAIREKLLSGGQPGPDGRPNYMWQDMLTREQAVTLFHRFAEMLSDRLRPQE